MIIKTLVDYAGCQIACIEAAFPFPLPETGCVVDTLLNTSLSQTLQSLTPSCQSAVMPDAQSVVVSGVPHDRVFGSVSMLLTNSHQLFCF